MLVHGRNMNDDYKIITYIWVVTSDGLSQSHDVTQITQSHIMGFSDQM